MDFLATQHLWLLYEDAVTDKNTATKQQYEPLGWPFARPFGLGTLALSLWMGGAVWADSPSQITYIAPLPGYHVNIRSGPGTQNPAVNTLAAGTAIALTGRYSQGWAELTDGNWVASNLISSRPSAGVSRGTTAQTAPPPGYHVNIRSGPGIGYPAVNTLAAGTPLTLTGRYSQGWAELTDGNWVAGNLITPSTYIGSQPSPGGSTAAASLSPPESSALEVLEAERDRSIALQQRLQTLGYLPADFTADGVKDRATVDAIRDFQRIHQLEIDGVAGPDTVNLLYSSSARYKNADHDEWVGIQNRLQALGYLPNDFTPNGVRGDETVQAIQEFQQEHGLVANGVADAQTLDVLYSARAQYRRGGTFQTSPPTPTVTPTPPTSPSPTATVSPTPTASPSPTPTETAVPDLDTSTGAREVQIRTDNGSEIPTFSGPGTEYDLVEFLEDGATVTVTGTIEGNWAEMSDGNWAYAPWLDL